MVDNDSIYLKPPATYAEMISRLKSRGLIVHDEDKAIELLKRIALDIRSNSIYGAVFIMKYLVQDKTIWNNWVTELNALFDRYAHICDIGRLGFYQDWEVHLRSVPTDIILDATKHT